MSANYLTLLFAFAPCLGEPPVKTEPVEYTPGLRIDWQNRRVEIDGAVCLREGPLELFACTAHTREHESIVVVKPRPLRIHEALGLIGLEPGHPVQYNDAEKRWLPPDGDRMTLQVRWTHKGETRTVNIGQWMTDQETGRPLPARHWAFAGSVRDKNGFAADVEGTIVCVVDFPSAIIALPEQLTADNKSLWVRANTAAIPPVGTAVTILVTPLRAVEWNVRIETGAKMTLDGTEINTVQLAERMKRLRQDGTYNHVRVTVTDGMLQSEVAGAEQDLRSILEQDLRLTIERRPPKQAVDPESRNGDSDQP